jgi:hypothetical protein
MTPQTGHVTVWISEPQFEQYIPLSCSAPRELRESSIGVKASVGLRTATRNA